MSVYSQRDQPAYRGMDNVPVEWSENPLIRKWWTSEHDRLLKQAIRTRAWGWSWGITRDIEKSTPPQTLRLWQQEDPLCKTYAWYNVLMYFAISRAKALGLLDSVRTSEIRACLFCMNTFREDSLPRPLIERLGPDNLLWCAPCLSAIILPGGSDRAKKAEVVAYLTTLTEAIERVPHQGYGEGVGDLHDMAREDLSRVLAILRGRPSVACVKKHFGSWLQALIQAGVLPDGTRPTGRGTQCVAKDGHVCFSLAEKTIDDWLSVRAIPHEKEPPYPGSNFRGDFLVLGRFVEFFGLVGEEEYESRMKAKRAVAKQQGLELIEILPQDIVSSKRLEKKLAFALGGR